MLLTVFTPTYNRAYALRKLYDSLCDQTFSDFEWMVVDDGSTDDTENLVLSFIDEGKILVRYIKQENGGKHRAINCGVKNASGMLFFIVDSDDYLTKDALQQVAQQFESVSDDDGFAGVSGMRITPEGQRIGGEVSFDTQDCTSLDLRMRYRISGDMAEVWRTDILRNYPFPEIDGEKFCPEALVWNRIAQHYKLRYFNRGIYVCQYLPDGLTAKITRLRQESSGASMMYYSELFHYHIPWMQKIKAVLNFWRFAAYSGETWGERINHGLRGWTRMGYKR
jgi:glycosyltransferase involved in cell wall biosynthesis